MTQTAEWISAPDACDQYNICSSIIHAAARDKKWDVKYGRSDKPGGGCKRIAMFRLDQIREWLENSECRRFAQARSVIKWVDSLKSWPSDDEINSHVTDVYRYNDIISVIETRKYRKKAELRKHES